MSPKSAGPSELDNGFDPANFPLDDELDGSAHFGNETRVNDFANSHLDTHGPSGLRIDVPSEWLQQTWDRPHRGWPEGFVPGVGNFAGSLWRAEPVPTVPMVAGCSSRGLGSVTPKHSPGDEVDFTVTGHQHYGLVCVTADGERGFVDSDFIGEIRPVSDRAQWPPVGSELRGLVVGYLPSDGRVVLSLKSVHGRPSPQSWPPGPRS